MATAAGGDRTIEVWWAQRGRHDWQSFTALLDPGEAKRLQALRRDEDRERFVLAATLARAALAARLGIEVREVALDRTCRTCSAPHGKPRLAAPSGDLELSITHSGALVGVAVTAGVAVGLDVEAVERLHDPSALEAGVLAPQERRALDRAVAAAGGAADRTAAFLQLWTRKEALTKMVGLGITVPLEEVVVSGPDEAARFLAWPGPDPRPDEVALHDLAAPVPGHVAAVAAAQADAVPVTRDGGTLLSSLS